jgi:hypothetical protein
MFPNKDAQFKKGNPGGGRPKGTKNRATILKKWMKVKIKINEKSNPLQKEIFGTVEDQVILALISKARSGDVQAIKEINDTLYGKIADKNELTGAGGKDLNAPMFVFQKASGEVIEKK